MLTATFPTCFIHPFYQEQLCPHGLLCKLAYLYVFGDRLDRVNRLASHRPQCFFARSYRATFTTWQSQGGFRLLYMHQLLGESGAGRVLAMVIRRPNLAVVWLFDGAGGVLVCIEGSELSQWGEPSFVFRWGPGAPGSARHRPKADLVGQVLTHLPYAQLGTWADHKTAKRMAEQHRRHPFAAAPRDGRDARPTGRREKLIRAQSRRTTEQNPRYRGCKGCRGRRIKH